MNTQLVAKIAFSLISILLVLGAAAPFVLQSDSGQYRWLKIGMVAMAGLFLLVKLVEVFLYVKSDNERQSPTRHHD